MQILIKPQSIFPFKVAILLEDGASTIYPQIQIKSNPILVDKSLAIGDIHDKSAG